MVGYVKQVANERQIDGLGDGNGRKLCFLWRTGDKKPSIFWMFILSKNLKEGVAIMWVTKEGPKLGARGSMGNTEA